MIKEKELGVIPANFHIYPSVPQLEVLKAADVFITHGGLNSVTESLYYGVPMVVIPFVTDQPTNAAQIKSLGLGTRLEYKKLTSEVLRKTTISLLSNKIVAKNVSDMQRKMQAINGNQYGANLIMQYYNTFVEGKSELQKRGMLYE